MNTPAFGKLWPRLAGHQRGISFKAVSERKSLFSSRKIQVTREKAAVMSSSSSSSSPPVSPRDAKSDVEGDIEDLPVPDAKLFSFLAFVKMEDLSEKEKLIHQRHIEALQKRQEMYVDPATGYSVLTRLAHLQRGSCCGNACRHCPFSQTAVANDNDKKKYNTAFFV